LILAVAVQFMYNEHEMYFLYKNIHCYPLRLILAVKFFINFIILSQRILIMDKLLTSVPLKPGGPWGHTISQDGVAGNGLLL
jgi:hypothetical protein